MMLVFKQSGEATAGKPFLVIRVDSKRIPNTIECLNFMSLQSLPLLSSNPCFLLSPRKVGWNLYVHERDFSKTLSWQSLKKAIRLVSGDVCAKLWTVSWVKYTLCPFSRLTGLAHLRYCWWMSNPNILQIALLQTFYLTDSREDNVDQSHRL